MEKYRITVRYSNERGVYVATVAEVADCKGEGGTRAEAISAVEQELAAQLEVMREQEADLPVPLDEQDFDGKIALQITPALHRELAIMAIEANVELVTLLTEMLSRLAAGPRRRPSGRRNEGNQGNRRRGGPQGQRYHDIMDNRANFIEYVRSLDGDGGGGGGGRGGRNRGGKR